MNRGYKILLFSSVLLLLTLFFITRGNTDDHSPNEAMKRLMAGNQRYVQSEPLHPDQAIGHAKTLSKGQHPFAAILGCADSRVPPEIIFDQGLGDLFVVREAGNVADPATLASLEYAVEHLGVSLIVVLGHESCGAVTAAVHGDYDGHLASLVDEILPAVEQVRGKVKDSDLIDSSVRENVKLVTDKIRKAMPILSEKVLQKKLQVVGAYYSLDSGKVEVITR